MTLTESDQTKLASLIEFLIKVQLRNTFDKYGSEIHYRGQYFWMWLERFTFKFAIREAII